jgi:type IV pilus assembly protein PilX
MTARATPWSHIAPCHRQQGSVLIVGMLLLLMMTLVALVSTNQTRTDARLTSNNLDRAIAFQAAEAALREAEAKLRHPNPAAQLSGDAGFYNAQTEPTLDHATWDASNSYDYGGQLPGLAEQPRYVIDMLSRIHQGNLVLGVNYHATERNIYRITVLASGRTAQAPVLLQTTYVPPDA